MAFFIARCIAVQKVTLFQNRILRINSHQQCSLERLKSDLAIANEELLKARVTIDKFNSNIRRLEEKESYEAARKITEPKHVTRLLKKFLNVAHHCIIFDFSNLPVHETSHQSLLFNPFKTLLYTMPHITVLDYQ